MTVQAALQGTPAERSLLIVPGAHCAGCIRKVEDGLGKLPGVFSVRLNMTSRQLTVDHDPALRVPDLTAALESIGFQAQPLIGDAAASRGKETRDLLRCTAVAGFASMNVMLLSVSVWSGATGATRDFFHLLAGLIAIPTVAYSGRPFFRSAWAAVSKGRTNMDVPISIGVLLVTCLSLFEAMTSGPHAYFDGAVMLLFFLLVGRSLDSIMRDRARDGVTALVKQAAAGAVVMRGDGRAEWIRADALMIGDQMVVAAGERLAADGIVVRGTSGIDRSLLTGESDPVRVGQGDEVHAGMLNLSSVLTVRVTATGSDTSVAEIARLMEDAAQGRSRYVRIADRAARLYAPAVHALAASSFLLWLLLGAGWHQSLMISAAVLIITCPCALGLAVPAAQIVAAGSLMRAGVLVKDGSALERLAEADWALFDKTGTLTLGRPELVDFGVVPAELLPVLLALSSISRHPLSQAITRSLSDAGVSAAALEECIETPGVGVGGRWGGVDVSLGRGRAMESLSATLTVGERSFELHFDDRLRPDCRETLKQLAALGVPASVASGDNARSVAAALRGLGLTAQTSMSPQDKLDAIERLHRIGRKVLMIGDGLNDGPALAAGHVSMAPASASDVGQNAADAVFLGDGLLPVARAILAARRTMKVVRQNFAIAIGYNVIAVPLAFAGLVTPLVAALAMSGSSVIVVANALRLRKAAQ